MTSIKFKKLARILLIILGFIVIWESIVWLFQLPFFILPGPGGVIKNFYSNATLIFTHAAYTLYETLWGFFLGGFAGIVTALCLIYFQWTRFWFLPIMLISQALPIFAIAPLLVLWFGYGVISKIAVAMLMIYFPIASNFYDGMRRTPSEWLNLGKLMGASRWRLLWYIRIPAALPALGSGLRVAATFAPMGAVIGEWVGSSRGLGYLMLNANARMQIDLMFAVLMMLILLTLALYFSVDFILKKYIFWDTEHV
jgi:putative hydroxymethylpyrimidine transport system permease protein